MNAKRDAALVIKDNAAAQRALVSRFGENDFGKALPVAVFIALCNKIGLNPWMGHITPWMGRPYVQHDGWLHLINREAPGELVGLESRPATKEEYERFSVAADDYFAIATVTRKYRNGNQVTYTRRAKITKRAAEPTASEQTARDKGGVGRHIVEDPWDMAEKRARVRALRGAFNDCMLSVAGDEAPASIDEAQIDRETGEVIGGEAVTQEGPDVDWSRLWASAHEQGMDKPAVHAFFKVPPYDGALKDYAEVRSKWGEQPLAQVVQDMADEIQLPYESQDEEQAGEATEPESEPGVFAGDAEGGAGEPRRLEGA